MTHGRVKRKEGLGQWVIWFWKRKLAGYVRVSTNTYAYGIRRGFALLVTDVAL